MRADTRNWLLQAAVRVTYEYGFGDADIAEEAKVPLGNIYYYFKTKDKIGEAIVELRLSRFKKLLQELDKPGTPKEATVRLRAAQDQKS
jgi:AcrR family transcriptional regulator